MAMGGGQYANLKNGIRYIIFTPSFDIYKGCNVLHNGEDTDLQISAMMTEVQHNELGYVYDALPDRLIELTDDNWIWTAISYYTGGAPFIDAQFIIHFQFDSNLDTIIDNSCITKGSGYSLIPPSSFGGSFIIADNQPLYPSFIEDTYFEPQEERYIMILTVGLYS